MAPEEFAPLPSSRHPGYEYDVCLKGRLLTTDANYASIITITKMCQLSQVNRRSFVLRTKFIGTMNKHFSDKIFDCLDCFVVISNQGRTDTVAPVARATVNFPSETITVVYRKVYPISRETLAAYSL